LDDDIPAMSYLMLIALAAILAAMGLRRFA
jgi:hypothetical protein